MTLLERFTKINDDEVKYLEKEADLRNAVLIGQANGYFVSIAHAKDGIWAFLIITKPTGEYHNWTLGKPATIIEQAGKIIKQARA